MPKRDPSIIDPAVLLPDRVPKGSRLWFAEESQSYEVRARNERYIVCSKPFNIRPTTCIYCVVDLEKEIRGPEVWRAIPDPIFSDKDCAALLDRITTGKSEISRRSSLPLRLVKVKPACILPERPAKQPIPLANR